MLRDTCKCVRGFGMSITITNTSSQICQKNKQEQTPCPLVRELTRPTDQPPLVGEIYCQLLCIEQCRVVSAADPLRSLISSKYLLIFSHKGWVDPVPDPLLLRKSGRARNRTRDLWVCSQELWLLDGRSGLQICHKGNLSSLKSSKFSPALRPLHSTWVLRICLCMGRWL
jgi:hypothetical protein